MPMLAKSFFWFTPGLNLQIVVVGNEVAIAVNLVIVGVVPMASHNPGMNSYLVQILLMVDGNKHIGQQVTQSFLNVTPQIIFCHCFHPFIHVTTPQTRTSGTILDAPLRAMVGGLSRPKWPIHRHSRQPQTHQHNAIQSVESQPTAPAVTRMSQRG
jgi:hypothetical protein